MADNKQNAPDDTRDPGSEEPLPLMQRFLDNPFLLLMLGVAVPTIFYLVWGIIEITQIPIAE